MVDGPQQLISSSLAGRTGRELDGSPCLHVYIYPGSPFTPISSTAIHFSYKQRLVLVLVEAGFGMFWGRLQKVMTCGLHVDI